MLVAHRPRLLPLISSLPSNDRRGCLRLLQPIPITSPLPVPTTTATTSPTPTTRTAGRTAWRVPLTRRRSTALRLISRRSLQLCKRWNGIEHRHGCRRRHVSGNGEPLAAAAAFLRWRAGLDGRHVEELAVEARNDVAHVGGVVGAASDG
jgi:hypothetical protein